MSDHLVVDQLENQWKELIPSENLVAIVPSLPDRYEIVELIGQGGTGSVYKVFDRKSGKNLAIKVLRPELVNDQSALKRFQQEAQSVARLDHPNLVTVYGHELDKENKPYIVMDYLNGFSLADVLKEGEPMDLDRLANIFLQVCDALQFAHLRGIIHRDLKPGNIILTQLESGGEKAHIVDFGIAKTLSSPTGSATALTQTGEVFGSPKYMSPEQCQGLELTLQSDIYSLGCVLYECLTGKAAFDGENPVTILLKHIKEELKFDSEFKHPPFAQVVLNCLEKIPTDRYQTAKNLQRDIEIAYKGHVVQKTRSRKYLSIGSVWILLVFLLAGGLAAIVTSNPIYIVGFAVLGLGITFVANFYNLHMDIEISPDSVEPADRWLCLLYLVVAFSTIPLFLWICVTFDRFFSRNCYLGPEVIKVLPLVVTSFVSVSLTFFVAWILRRRDGW